MAKQAAPPSTLHPVLKAALGCMDVQLEDELARYRRRRAEERAQTGPAPATAPAPASETATIPPGRFANAAVATATASDANDIADFTRQPRPSSAAAPAAASSAPEDDLESTKQLRRNLPAPEPAASPLPSWRDRLLTPLGVGSLLVLGASGLLLGSALLAPESLDRLASRWLPGDRPEPEATTDAQASSDAASSLDLEGSNVAGDEFDPLDLDALSTVETGPETPEARPEPNPTDAEPPQIRAEGVPGAELPGRESDLTTALLSPSPAATPEASPSPTPNLADDPAVANAAPGPAEGDRFYYVVASYGGEASLRQARNIVPEAYLRRFPQGVQIQMGAFASEADAEALIERLAQQGIAASVFRRQ